MQIFIDDFRVWSKEDQTHIAEMALMVKEGAKCRHESKLVEISLSDGTFAFLKIGKFDQ